MASIGRASTMLASGTMVSRVLGFLNVFMLTRAIGSFGDGANAFAAANQLPNTVYVIVAGGVLNAVLVPMIVRSSVHADGGAGYINKLLTLALALVGLTTVVATLCAPWLVAITVHGYSPAVLHLATIFAYWCLPQIFFYGLYTLLGEILNARNVFGPFTWAPMFNNVVAIAGYVLFIVLFGSDLGGTRPAAAWSAGMITTLGATATLGVVTQACMLILFWRRAGLKFRPDFRWRGVGLGDAGRMAGWTFAMLIVTTLAGFVDTNVASLAGTADASVRVLQTAWLIFMLPHSIITVSIATVYFTRMSEAGAAGRIDALKADISSTIRGVCVFIVAATAVLIAVALPFSSLFTDTFAQTQAMASVVIAYVAGLVSFTLLFVLQRAFYALRDTKTPFYFTLVQCVLFSTLTLACALLPSNLIAVGIALAQTVSCTVEFILAWYLLHRRIGGFDGARITRSLVRYGVAAIPAGAVAWAVLLLFGGARPHGFGVTGFLGPILTMIVVGLAAAVVYLGVLVAMRTPEVTDALALLRSRIRRG